MQVVYVCNSNTDEELWKETIIKHKMQGVHILSASVRQDYFWGNLMSPNSKFCCAIFDESGKYKRVKTPTPTDFEGWDNVLRNWK